MPDLTTNPTHPNRSKGVALSLQQVRRVFRNGKSRPDQVVIGAMNLEIAVGEFLAILGPSGCGKSTLLRLMARLTVPDSGKLEMQPETFRTGFVFQDAQLLPWRTVLDNAALPLELQGVDREQRGSKARTILAQVGLADAEQKYPAQLSGGMRMRVSLARALVTEPHLLLLDEPFAALDEITRFQLEVQLRQLWQQRGMTVIFVTHSISEAAFIANRAIVLSRRGGNVELDHRIDLPEQRSNALRADASLGREMSILMAAMQQE